MAEEYHRLRPAKYQKLEYAESKFTEKCWKKYQFPKIVKEYSAINCIDFCPVMPYNFAVTCSAKIQVFSSKTGEVVKLSSRNKENVYGARFRADGQLLVAGGESGLLQLLDSNSRSILRNLRGHTKAARVCFFSNDFSSVLSGSDDKTVRVWDILKSAEVNLLKGHQDYVRAGCINPTSSNILLTGSYDHSAKIWDSRTAGEAMLTLNHGQPVESVLYYKTGGTCYTSGGNYIRVWDIISGGRMLHEFSNHQKTITCMAFDGSFTRLLSGSLDRHIKVYNVQDYSTVAHLDYPSPILSIGISQTGSHLVAGMSDGAISIRIKSTEAAIEETEQRRKPRTATYKHFIRGQGNKPKEGDVVIDPKRHIKKVGKVDKLLRQFKYHQVLDYALNPGSEINATISLIRELARQNALKIALSERDFQSLAPLLKFITSNICNPRYSKLLIEVTSLLTDMYTSMIGQYPQFDQALRKIQSKIKYGMHLQSEMMRCLGIIDTFVAMATTSINVDCSKFGQKTTFPIPSETENITEKTIEALAPEDSTKTMASEVICELDNDTHLSEISSGCSNPTVSVPVNDNISDQEQEIHSNSPEYNPSCKMKDTTKSNFTNRENGDKKSKDSKTIFDGSAINPEEEIADSDPSSVDSVVSFERTDDQQQEVVTQPGGTESDDCIDFQMEE